MFETVLSETVFGPSPNCGCGCVWAVPDYILRVIPEPWQLKALALDQQLKVIPVRGTDGPIRGMELTANLIVKNVFDCNGAPYGFNCRGARANLNSVQWRGSGKSTFLSLVSGGFWFSQDRLFSRNSTRKPFNLIKSPIFTNAACNITCLYNAPSIHTVESLRRHLGTEKVPQRNCVTKILPNVRVNFLVRFASKPLFYWAMTQWPPRIVQKILWCCSCDFLALWLLFGLSEKPAKNIGPRVAQGMLGNLYKIQRRRRTEISDFIPALSKDQGSVLKPLRRSNLWCLLLP